MGNPNSEATTTSLTILVLRHHANLDRKLRITNRSGELYYVPIL